MACSLADDDRREDAPIESSSDATLSSSGVRAVSGDNIGDGCALRLPEPDP